MEAFERFEHAGFTCELHYDEDGGHADPRDADNLGTMVCWHPEYALGDEQFTSPGGRGYVVTPFDTECGRYPSSMQALERYLRLMRGALVVLPLFLLDNSGLSLRAGSPSACDPGGWDTTMVGFIYTTAGRIAELCGAPVRDGDPFYCPRDWEGTAEAWIAEQLDVEVRLYSAFLSGQVYGWVVRDARGEVVESCWGYLPGVDHERGQDGLEYLRQEAREAAESEQRYRARRRVETCAGWAAAHRILSAGWSA